MGNKCVKLPNKWNRKRQSNSKHKLIRTKRYFLPPPKVGKRYIFTMRPIANSSSCSTLIDLSLQNLKSSVDECDEIYDVEFNRTELLLPRDEFEDQCEDDSNEYLYLPSYATGTSNLPVDVYLRGIPEIINGADSLLAQNPRVFEKQPKRKETILNVFQGEVAHAVPSQCDIMVSDDATTCHIVAIRSYTSKKNRTANIFTSLTHIDSNEYEQCIRKIFQAHEDFHHIRSKNTKVEMDLHVMGGFDDEDGTSRKTSEFLLTLFAAIAHEKRSVFQTRLQTCAITSINDDGRCSPIGRGFGIELKTGNVFLASVEHDMEGPGYELRFARGWTISEDPPAHQLHVIHDICGPNKGCIIVQPFQFRPFKEMYDILSLPDDIMLKYTSTSPDVEKDNFCDNLRRTLLFIQRVRWWDIFGPDCDKPAVFKRSGVKGNDWMFVES